MNEWLFENPWPLALLLGAVALIGLWRALTGGGQRDWIAAGIAATLAALSILVGRLVVTPGEHAQAAVEEFIDRAIALDVDGAFQLFTADAVFNYGNREAPSEQVGALRSALESLKTRNRIESNRVTRIAAATLDDRTGEVEFSCSTAVERVDAAVPSRWIARVRRVGERWQIDRLTFVSLFAQPAVPRVWR
ncbi:MAG: hypothetical protein QM516_02545 [Limnohabitans sp.]|nr:hypothetical protein [Limnohabitans sp.]